MPSRGGLEAIPSCPYRGGERLDLQWGYALSCISLGAVDSMSLGALGRAAQVLYGSGEREFLGGDLDPRCVLCGQETQEGEVRGAGPGRYRVMYLDCGHEVEMTDPELRSLVSSDCRGA